ncbi:hypothetical protein DIE07_08645 [Burkholderia sp. Bp9002]|nr:hypothetical protein DIE07_08645 [Burkholderia sp. Bp9002]
MIARRIDNYQDLDTYLKDRITMLNAGAISQAFDGEQVIARRLDSIRNHNGSDDIAKATEVFAVYLNCRLGLGEDDEYCSFDNWREHPLWKECDDRATELVRANWSAITRIVDHVVHIFETRKCDVVGKNAPQLEEIGWGAAA